jgi:ribonucleoside-diphosphate reductase beta chain
MFLGEPVAIARYDQVRYPWLDKLSARQRGFFWLPEEIDLSRDKTDFSGLSDHERHIFTENLKRQIVLDSVQGRSPVLAFGPHCSLPELEVWLQTWAFSETVHSLSYTHIIRNVYPDPSAVFDSILDEPEIVQCARDISEAYDDLIEMTTAVGLMGYGTHYVGVDVSTLTAPQNHHAMYVLEEPALRDRIWRCLMAVNALEGVRFYVSFACSWAFAELGRMEGNAKIIEYIARDENLHLAGTQQILKALAAEDSEWRKTSEDNVGWAVEMFGLVIEQEKAWARHLFKDGSMVGLNARLLEDYVDFIAAKRLTAIGLKPWFKPPSTNPLPWTQKWISGGNAVQPAPQEVNLTYVLGGVKSDVSVDFLKGLRL